MKPCVYINFKKKTGKEILNIISKLSENKAALEGEHHICLIIQPQDAILFSERINFPVYIQDTFSEMKILEIDDYSVFNSSKIHGVIINHPDKKENEEEILKKVEFAKKLNIETIICATSVDEAVSLEKITKPDFIAIEVNNPNKELDFIDKNKNVIENAKKEIKSELLFGGGIKTGNDVSFVLKSGIRGILISGLIVNSDDPCESLKKLLFEINIKVY